MAQLADVAVKVTVATPPQADGAAVLLFVTVTVHPPASTHLALHTAYFVSIAVCV